MTTKKPAKKPSEKPAQKAPAKLAKPTAKTYVVFGADEFSKPRAARFSVDKPELLAKAVESLHLRMIEVTDPDLAEVADQLPLGRLHATGQGLVPFIKGRLYADLVGATVGDQEPPAHPDPKANELPRSWEELGPGHLVIARESLECGWWEAIVVERTGDLVTLKYRDYPRYPNMVRHRSAVALISPAVEQAAAE
ncbi:hypothetical protein RA307_15130 [Xanthobacteraceae bacterium Astr-EGSB]|uniref:hypothetical protein n=1 Tax=Astrobacterium formosum TaxID=3069710 RepID=UPI0027B1B9DC|nr:hypothetical protein [Xanthobacteraceae bacterium Astr-EGSB]